MENPQPLASSSHPRMTKTYDDISSITSFGNPFSEDEQDQSSYALVSSLISKVKNTFATSIQAPPPIPPAPQPPILTPANVPTADPSRKVSISNPPSQSQPVPPPLQSRPNSFNNVAPRPAPPLVSLTPVISESPTFVSSDSEGPSANANRGPPSGMLYPTHTGRDGDGMYSTSIPGFPMQDDARSIRTAGSLKKNNSVSKVIRRLRGEGLSRDYWMDDDLCKECYDCKSVFTTWRRKHHCRICGQIFCSRCASNIIKGSRFGQEGVVRVCNLCLQMLEEDTYDDNDDDRRSVTSIATSGFPAHQLESVHSQLPQSPFSASQLFRTDEPFNLFSIAEMGGSGGSRGFGGEDADSNGVGNGGDEEQASVAPFRRRMSDEDKDVLPSNALESFIADSSPQQQASASRSPEQGPQQHTVTFLPFPTQAGDAAQSSIQFPGSNSPEGTDSPRPIDLRSRVSSFATEGDIHTPFLRSRVQSRLGEFTGEAGWRTRRESSAYAAELNAVSMFHLRIMVRQMLAKENVANLKEWEDVLLKLALRVASYLTFNPRAPGASMDVRQYVKIKKIPGGLPKDSEYVDGAVITKNVAHKQMLRNIKNPRIMLLTFPFDYHRVEGQFMSFQPLLAQEKEYLNNLVSRVAALRPHVVLVERSVSRLALESLLQANIAVARQVKPSALQFVSRVTQAQVISSMDRLALEPHMGQCSRFRIQTFEHALIPGRRKTYMRFEGCSREMGCTIVLRGENLQTLKRIKAVTSFMVFIVRNLKLETFLWKDLVISMPPVSTDAAPSMFLYSSIYGPHPSFMPRSSSRTPMSASAPLPRLSPPRELPEAEVDLSEEDLPDEEAARLRLSRRIQNSVEPYLSTFISASATLRFPPPYPIWRMKELDDKLEKVKRAWEDEEAALILQAERRHAQETTITQASALMDSPGATSPGSVGTPGLTRTPMGSESNASPNPTDPPPAYFDQNIANLPSRDSYMSIPSSRSSSLIKSSLQDPPLAVPVAVHEVAEIAKQSALVRARAEHEEHSRVWEWYLRKNDDDFLVQKYQCICIRHFIVPTLELTLEKACFMPQLKYMTYYGENDQTLGQFIEDCVVEAHDTKKVCPGKGCKKLMVAHSNVYVHNQTRVLVAAEPWKGQIGTKKAGATPVYDKITTFSYCRVCGQATPFIPISEEALKYSFAKFLELHFYPADVLLMHGAGCEHNIYQHHVRYFAWHGMTIRFQTDPVDLYEVTFPPMRSRVRLETLLEFKNRDYENMLLRNAAYWESVLAKIKQLQTLATTALDISSQEKGTGPLTNAVNDLMQRAEEDRAQILNMIHHTYQQSPPSDTLALGSVRSSIQDKVVQWDIDFERFEKNFLPVKAFLNIEKDLRTMTRTHHFKRLYDDFFGNASSASDMEGKSYIRTERPLDLLAASSASENESAPDEKLAYTSEPEELTAPKAPDQEATPSPQLPPITIPSEVNLDPDSDSTISAARTRPDTSPAEPTSVEQQADAGEARKSVVPYASRLPRWTRTNPSVADLVKQFQSLLPDNETFAEDPLKSMSESDREADAQPKRRPRVKAPLAKKSLPKQVVTSDFESSYAYNAGPRHFTHNKRNAPNALADVISRIPGPVTTVKNSPTDSRSPSRRPTVDDSGKQGRPSGVTTSTVKSRMGRPSPYDTDGGAASIRSGKGKGVSRLGRDKPTPRPAAPPSSMRPVSRRVPTQSAGNRVSTLARQFERLSKDTERVNRRYAVMRGRRARPPAIARAKVEIFDNIRDAVRDGSDESSSSSSEADDEDDGDDETRRKKSDDTNESANPALLVVENTSTEASTSSLEPQEATSATVESPTSMNNASNEVSSNTSPDPSVPPTPFIHHGDYSKERHPLSESETGSTAADQQSFINNLSSWLKPNTNEVSLQYPSSAAEHVFKEASITVREDEPTSIIAFTLSSSQHRMHMEKSKASRQVKVSEKPEKFMPDDASVGETLSTWGVISVDEAQDPADLMKHPPSVTHQSFQFESGGVTISCTVFCAEQFDALRRSCDCDHSMIESLARCLKWDATGGKSGSAFLKTRDDRFMAKELSKTELEAMTKFAPAYFEYMSNALTSNRPTLLAKIFGFYKISYKNPMLGKTVKMNLLVMENLFYGRRFSRIYDLKGSMRNRHVHATGRENEVLLDENLVQNQHLIPFYVREHSKRILRGALWNDSKFLADLNVMDYSLLVAVDNQKNELIVGIVDFIRTYTWDKKLESWVKESAFLGGGGKGEPTIVTPKQYKARFRSAMERYFPLVPDRWMKQKDAPDDEGDSLLEMWPDW